MLRETWDLFERRIYGQILSAKMRTYQKAVNLDERNVISNAEKTSKVDAIQIDVGSVRNLEESSGNVGYRLPNPKDSMYELKWTLEKESKQALEDALGEYGQYIFYQGEDTAEYFTILLDAVETDKAIDLR
jgi:hypothetical protein